MADKTTMTKVEIRYIPNAKVGKLFMKAQLGDATAFLDFKELELIDMPGMDASRRSVAHPKNLETIYKHYQRVDDTADERCAQLKVRSMSVGDAIVVKGKAYYVVQDGFAFKDANGELVAVTPENCD
jgi:hypothetical protein